MEKGNFNWAAFIPGFPKHLPAFASLLPWQVSSRIVEMMNDRIATLNNEYRIDNGVAIHSSAVVENHAVLKGPAIIGPDCFVAAHCYLRGGVLLLRNNSLGPGCEMKSSILFPYSNLAHFNFIGDSIVGTGVNFEAGAVIANHFNERKDKEIQVLLNGEIVRTGTEKFGALVGDGCKIGANAVLSPGTILAPSQLVKRLELVEQIRS